MYQSSETKNNFMKFLNSKKIHEIKAEADNNDSEYIALLKKKLELERQKPDKPSKIYDIASNTLTLAVGITAIALGSAATFGAPAIAIGLGGALYAGYKEYQRIKLSREIKKLDHQISKIEKDQSYESEDLSQALEIKTKINQISHKKRKISNFIEMAFGAYGTISNTVQIGMIGTAGVAGALIPYASLAIGAVGLVTFTYAEYKRRQETKKYNPSKKFNDLEGETPLLEKHGKYHEQVVSSEQNITPKQEKPKKNFLDWIKPKDRTIITKKSKSGSFTQRLDESNNQDPATIIRK
jgi:hypothetical protein